MQRAPASLHRTTMRVALCVLVVVVVLSVAEVMSERFNAFTRDHSLISTFLTEAILLVGVYLVIDEIIQRRETRRWGDVMSLGIRALSVRAEGTAGVIRRAVDELADASLNGAVDYEEFVSRCADELADRLRADDSLARSFAEAARQSASRLEEAIIRWGPTLVEDPDSAELLNLLPDIVDSARVAADAIAPSSGWDETVGATRGWKDGERQFFKNSLLDILKNADEFHRRVSRRAPS